MESCEGIAKPYRCSFPSRVFPFSACEKAAEKVAIFLVSIASFTVKTGFSEQVIQSSVRRRHGCNLNQLIENEENVTLPFEMISIIFMQFCNATPKMYRGGFQCLLKGKGKQTATLKFPRFLAEFYRKCCAFLNKEMLFSKFSFKRFKYNQV